MYGMLGKMSEGLGSKRVKGGSLQKLVDTDPDAMDPENFAVEYPRIVSLKVESEGGRRTKITLLTSDQKIELRASPVAIEGIRDFVQSVLSGKVEYRH